MLLKNMCVLPMGYPDSICVLMIPINKLTSSVRYRLSHFSRIHFLSTYFCNFNVWSLRSSRGLGSLVVQVVHLYYHSPVNTYTVSSNLHMAGEFDSWSWVRWLWMTRIASFPAEDWLFSPGTPTSSAPKIQPRVLKVA